MLSTRSSTVLVRAAAGAVVAGLAVAGLAVGSAGADDEARVAPAGPSTASLDPGAQQPAAIGAVQADQASALRVLRRPRRASDAVPADAMPAAGPARFGRNPYLARAVALPDGKGWVVPGDGVVCLVVEDPVDGYGSTCDRTANLARRGLTLGAVDRRSAVATTLVPDGAVVTAEGDDGRDATVEPDGAGVVVVDADETAALDVATDAGHARTRLYDSRDLRSGAVR